MKLQNENTLLLLDATFLLYVFGANANYKREIVTYLDALHYNTGCTRYVGFLDGPSAFNYRYAVEATYKGNRDKSKITDKFPYFYEVKEFLIKTLRFSVVNVLEVDDLLSVVATELNRVDSEVTFIEPIFNSDIQFSDNEEDEYECEIGEFDGKKASIDFIVASADKDLAQIECHLFSLTSNCFSDNYQKYLQLSNNRKKIEASGKHLLYLQCMTGDSADNIKGIPNYGPVKSYNALKDVPEDELENEVLKHYVNYYKDETEAKQQFTKTFNLVYLPKKIKLLNLKVSISRFDELSHLDLYK